MNWLESNVKQLLTIICICAIIVGFFIGIVSSDVFYATMGIVITHFYQGNMVNKLNNRVKEQEAEIQSLKDINEEKNI